MKAKKIPMRKCVACQEMMPKKQLLRIVRVPEMDIVVDLSGKKSGRGAYLCYKSDCLKTSRKRKSLEKALEVSIKDHVYEQIQQEIDKYNEANK